MKRLTVIESIPQAFKVMEEMGAEEFNDTHKGLKSWKKYSAEAMIKVIEQTMHSKIDEYLEEIRKGESLSDRRNGYYTRKIITMLGRLDIKVPRTRRYNPVEVLKAYSKRTRDVDFLILSCFTLGLSTRKVTEALLSILGVKISPSIVSKISKTLDEAVEAFHKRPLRDEYKALIIDGVVLKRKTGMGALKVFVLVVLGIREDGKKEVVDFRTASSESEKEWERFLNSLYNRGLKGDHLEIITVDGGKGALAALDTVYPYIPVQRCWAHKVRNITSKVRKKDREEVKKGLNRIYNAKGEVEARKRIGKWAREWEGIYPSAAECLKKDIESLLVFFKFSDEKWRKITRTTNAIERKFREVKRRTRPMGAFFDRTSIERIVFAVVTRENKLQGVPQCFALTQNY